MTSIKRMKLISVAVLVILLSLIHSAFTHADEEYPLEPGERLVEQTRVDDTHAEMYTLIEDQYYAKKLEKSEGQWTVVHSEAIRPKWTGLLADETSRRGDRELSRSIQKELSRYGLEPNALPAAVDYSQSEFLPPVGEQFENSCVGWSIGYYLRTYQQAKDIGWDVWENGHAVAGRIFSPAFIYNQINYGADNGALLTEGADLLQQVGAATMADFPYVQGDYWTQPDEAAIRSAYPHRVREWKLLYSNLDSDDYMIRKIKEYLNTGDLVVAGGKVGVKFWEPSTDAFGNSIVTNDYSVLGNHAYVIVGYDDNFESVDGRGAFKLINSWGPQWGNGGFSYISYRAFATYALEGYVFTDLVNVAATELRANVADKVTFNLNLSGTGKYDVAILNSDGRTVYEEKNRTGANGMNVVTWDGKDLQGNAAQDGTYKIKIVPYRNGAPKPPFEAFFLKSGKVISVESHIYRYENTIEYADIQIANKSSVTINIKVTYDNETFVLRSNETVYSGETTTYRINKKQFDFNGKNLNRVRIDIDVE